jgi:hypothetical protein
MAVMLCVAVLLVAARRARARTAAAYVSTYTPLSLSAPRVNV